VSHNHNNKNRLPPFADSSFPQFSGFFLHIAGFAAAPPPLGGGNKVI
jgi:hypothetical protein